MKNKFKRYLSLLLAIQMTLATLSPGMTLAVEEQINNELNNLDYTVEDDTENEKLEDSIEAIQTQNIENVNEPPSSELDNNLAQPMQVTEQEYVIENGVLTRWNKPSNFSGSVVIPEGVTSIAAHVFQSGGISSVTLPEGLTTIQEYAFADNTIKELNLPDSLTTIGANAFRDNELTSLNTKNLTTIGISAFHNNELESLVIGDPLQKIEDSAFKGNNLSEVRFPNSDDVTLGSEVFAFNRRYVRILGNNLAFNTERVTAEN